MSRPVNPLQIFGSLVHADASVFTMIDVVSAVQSMRVVRGWLDRFETQIASRSNELNVSAADVLTRNAGISAAEARAKDRRSKALEHAPSFSDALAEGAVSSGHTDALANATARLDDATKELFLEHEASLLDQATHSTPEEFARHCRQLKNRIAKDQGIERSERQKRETSLRSSICPRTGMYRLSGEFDPELGHRIFTSLDTEVAAMIATRKDTDNDDRQIDRNHLAAHALARLIAGGHQAIRPAATEIVVHIDLDTLTNGLHEHSTCEFSDGETIPVDMARRLACNAHIIPVVLSGDSVPLDLGRSQRLANADQRRALRAIHRTCAFDGCDTPFEKCQIHHVNPWEHGGETNLADMAPICPGHHHKVHEGGWTLTIAPDRTITIRRPDGELHSSQPPERQRQKLRAKQHDKQTDQTMQPLHT
jgi:hypothetical protein